MKKYNLFSSDLSCVAVCVDFNFSLAPPNHFSAKIHASQSVHKVRHEFPASIRGEDTIKLLSYLEHSFQTRNHRIGALRALSNFVCVCCAVLYPLSCRLGNTPNSVMLSDTSYFGGSQ